jgi:hypothetical protein
MATRHTNAAARSVARVSGDCAITKVELKKQFPVRAPFGHKDVNLPCVARLLPSDPYVGEPSADERQAEAFRDDMRDFYRTTTSGCSTGCGSACLTKYINAITSVGHRALGENHRSPGWVYTRIWRCPPYLVVCRRSRVLTLSKLRRATLRPLRLPGGQEQGSRSERCQT